MEQKKQKNEYLNEVIFQAQGMTVDVTKEDADVVGLAVYDNDLLDLVTARDVNVTAYLTKTQVFDLIATLIEMYGCMEDDN